MPAFPVEVIDENEIFKTNTAKGIKKSCIPSGFSVAVQELARSYCRRSELLYNPCIIPTE